MRTRFVFCLLLFGAALIFAGTPEALSQKKFGGGGGPPGGGAPGGGMMGMMSDPTKYFEMVSRGRGYFMISDTRMMRDSLTKWAEQNRISDGKVTQAQFMEYWKVKDNFGAPGAGGMPLGGAPGGKGGPTDSGKGGPPIVSMDKGGGKGGPSGSGGAPPSEEVLNAWAESEFKRRDRNDDNYLSYDEMSDSLRNGAGTYDKDGDGRISGNEYREFFRTRFQSGGGGDRDKGVVDAIIELEDLDRRPTVIRFGKLPKELPGWFTEYDENKDGQVELYEWRTKREKSLSEFNTFDLNRDGLITPEEILRQQATLRASADTVAMSSSGEKGRSRDGGSKGPGGGKGGFNFEFKRP